VQLFTSKRAPNPRRVLMFLAEKGLHNMVLQDVDLMAGAHRSPAYLRMNPLAKVPVLELDDGRFLSESRAICTYLEGLQPEPNLMGVDATERAFIEMADRQIELTLFLQIANAIRHTHPGLAALEQPQFADFGKSQAEKVLATAAVFDRMLQQQDWMAGSRFTIADITAYCGLEFARGLMKFNPADAGLHALQAWRDKVHARASAKVV
jgi:glutathione S-transferase